MAPSPGSPIPDGRQSVEACIKLLSSNSFAHVVSWSWATFTFSAHCLHHLSLHLCALAKPFLIWVRQCHTHINIYHAQSAETHHTTPRPARAKLLRLHIYIIGAKLPASTGPFSPQSCPYPSFINRLFVDHLRCFIPSDQDIQTASRQPAAFVHSRYAFNPPRRIHD